MLNNINTIEDVKVFAFQLVHEHNLSFHPDNDFSDYVNTETNIPIYTTEESERYNELMDKCFDICKQNNEDVYELMGQPLLKRLKIGIYSKNIKK